MADLADPTARVTADGRLLFAGVTYRAALGRGGVRADKQEGDGATPAAQLPLRRVFYRADRIAKPRTPLPVEPLARSDGWCDDVSDRAYNTHITRPFAARHEMLWRDDPLYDVCVVLGWNDAPVVRGRGSAIFLHLARPDYAPTEGCVALALRDLLQLLAAGVRELAVTLP